MQGMCGSWLYLHTHALLSVLSYATLAAAMHAGDTGYCEVFKEIGE
jgi:lactam utilization protein B